MALSFAMQNADADAPETVAKTELKLDYSRVDTLPELPGLASSSAAGCAFCEVLRHDLMATWKSIEEKGEEEEEHEIPEPEENDSDAESEGEKEGNDAGDGDDNGGGEEKEARGEDAKDEEGPVSDEDTNKPRYEDIDTDSDAEIEPDTEPDEQTDDANVQAEDSNDSDQENQEEPATKRAPRDAKLIITEVTYKLREHGSDDERLQRTWLDAMNVFFTIDCEEKTRDYSIHYTIYADRAADGSPGDTDLQNAAWRTRGWTFQEDQLASRKVFFGNLMFHVSRGSTLEAADGSSIGHFRFMEDIDSLERGLSTWYSMIAGYSARNLTVQQDKFPAISALARSFAEGFPDQKYLAGLWESNIHMGLLWTCPAWMEFDKFQDLVSKKYTAPSWSWARRPLQVSWILSGDEHPTSELVIRETEVISEKHNPYGRVSKGRLLLTAKIFKPPTQKNGRVRLKHSYKYWKYMNVPTFNYMLRSKRKIFMAKILFDWDSYCAIKDNRYPRGPMGDVSLLLTASIFPGDAPMMKNLDLPDD
ncbi:hypothetical protein HZS61_010688 [Fusarium oxysporum f. sp. conglutinans]|uniref:Heterokaryon incompatibility domain-containing protein n=1 Tax=Fusarium oxysporum f. sp. conglutinans TaxID=100902 RepID=A0A8H6GUN1_FUSOX|nr:hypothetical protein HZS61_010688 [Fusarium oxysporum f. sp. conglutinans]